MHGRWSGLVGLALVVAALLGPAPPVVADSLATTSTYFIARRDFRRCVSPLCGGLYVKRLNQASTTCNDGVSRSECYVPGIAVGRITADADEKSYLEARVASGFAIVRGTIAAKNYAGYGNLGVLKVTEAWDGATDAAPSGRAYLVNDSGIRCATTPCMSFHTAALNTTTSGNITDLVLENVVNVSQEAIDGAYEDLATGKILVAGTTTASRGRVTLQALAFYRLFHARVP